MKKNKSANKKVLKKAVAQSSKIEGFSLPRAKKNVIIIRKLKKHGRAFSI